MLACVTNILDGFYRKMRSSSMRILLGLRTLSRTTLSSSHFLSTPGRRRLVKWRYTVIHLPGILLLGLDTLVVMAVFSHFILWSRVLFQLLKV